MTGLGVGRCWVAWASALSACQAWGRLSSPWEGKEGATLGVAGTGDGVAIEEE
ncbi:MAG TPA: hypothetical protein PLU39_07000 [Armatimonadota bacterium]|nr:hypothetical protein [Armatimonadota bacterium]HOJ20808.1 hypothetical protein [Armatimonadota bacterium]HOM82428.1 hypothetical protein [Armatimonadota bacterium]HOQ30242.1 hypothetical protein [Armatimonadota bacterium]HPO71250.1 hypothetical protein [Armatimonadota bacterium]